MHAYATDSSERKTVNIVLALAGVILALVLHWILQTVKTGVPWWVDIPSVMGFYGILYSAFDRRLWKLGILHKVGLVKVADLSGTWIGYVCSSFDNHAEQHEATLTINQTWTKISINMRTERSDSHSQVSAIFREPEIVVRYQYLSEPRSDSKDTMHTHRGTAWLVLRENGLEGEYYTGRDRQNHGKLSFQYQR